MSEMRDLGSECKEFSLRVVTNSLGELVITNNKNLKRTLTLSDYIGLAITKVIYIYIYSLFKTISYKFRYTVFHARRRSSGE